MTKPDDKGPALPPPAPDGVDKELWSILASLCPIAFQREVKCNDGKCDVVPGGRITLGCRSWPGAWAGPDGRAPENVNPYSGGIAEWEDPQLESIPFLPIEAHYDGAFTRPSVQQKILYLENCRVMDGMTITGCAVVVEKRAGKWIVDASQREADFLNCVTSRRSDGRDLLACHSSIGALREAIVRSLFYVDFTRPDGTDQRDAVAPTPEAARRTRIAALVHNGFGIPCSEVPPANSQDRAEGFWSGGITHLDKAKLTSKDVNRDGRLDVVLEFDRYDVAVDANTSTRIKNLCQKIRAEDSAGRGFLAIEKLLSNPIRFQLHFVNDGSKLVPAAGTRRLLKRWGGAPLYVW